MAFTPPNEVTALQSFAEVISWVVGAYAPADGAGSLDEVSRIRQVQNLRSAHLTRGTINYGGAEDVPRVPGHLHVAWFLRIGAAGTRELADIPRDALFNSLAVGSKDYFDKESFYRLDDLVQGVPIPSDVAAWLEREAPVFGKTPQKDGALQFDAARVNAAINATRSAGSTEGSSPPAEPGKASASHVGASQALGGARPDRRASISAPALNLIAPDGRELLPTWHANRLILTDAVQSTPEEGLLVDSRGRLVACQIGSHLVMGDVNRITATISAWSSPVDLGTLGDGSVLAVGCAGQHGALFVLSDTSSTWLCHATPDGNAQRLVHLAATASRAAVLHGAYALLGTAGEDGDAVECARFPGLDVEWLRFAAAGGHSLLIAGGRSSSGDEGTWLSLDGASPRSGPEASALKLPLSGHEPPSLTTSEIEWASAASPISFDRWFHPTHGSRLRTA